MPFQKQKSPEQNCVYKWSILGLQKGVVGGTGVLMWQRSVCVDWDKDHPCLWRQGGDGRTLSF